MVLWAELLLAKHRESLDIYTDYESQLWKICGINWCQTVSSAPNHWLLWWQKKSIQVWKFCWCSDLEYSTQEPPVLLHTCRKSTAGAWTDTRVPAWQVCCQKFQEAIDKSGSPLSPYMCEYRCCKCSKYHTNVEEPSSKPWEELLLNVAFWINECWIWNIVPLCIKPSLCADWS